MNGLTKVVVGVDFSDCSLHALEYAAKIASRARVSLVMVWVNNPIASHMYLSSDQAESLVEKVEIKFNRLINKYRDLLAENIEYVICEGKVFREVVRHAPAYPEGLIVTGTHGASGFEEFWIGSNAYKIVSESSCPVLTVREGFDAGRNVSRIVLPVDSSRNTRQKVSYTARLAKLFDAEVFVLSLYSSNARTRRDIVGRHTRAVETYLQEEGVRFNVEYLDADNITTTTIDFARSIDAEMVVIMTEQERSASNIWLGPYAQQMVNHSPVPVLSFHPRENISE